MSITYSQCRAARAAVKWTQAELSKRSGVSKSAIANFERGATEPQSRSTVFIRKAFEDVGVKFGYLDQVIWKE